MTSANTDPALLQQIASRRPYLSAAMQQVAGFVLDNPEAVRSMSITTLAAAAGVAESTVSRFTRELGLPSYQALRLGVAESTFAIRSDQERAQAFVYDGIGRDDPPRTIIEKIRHSSAQSLTQTAVRLDDDAVLRAVELIEASTALVFTCMGASSIAAEEGVMRFTRAGRRCILHRDQSLQAMVSTILEPTDVVVAISDSGHSTSIVDTVREARRRGTSTVVITSHPDSPLAQAGDVSLYTASVPSGGELYGESVTAKWGQLLVVDTLYAAYAARNAERTLEALERTYAAGIRQSRS
jgi:DNA-binding MurR/RpiR family transcriptional regulator